MMIKSELSTSLRIIPVILWQLLGTRSVCQVKKQNKTKLIDTDNSTLMAGVRRGERRAG